MRFGPACDLSLIASNLADGTRPAATTNGTSVTPAQNTWGSWTTVIASGSVTARVHRLDMIANGWNISTAARDTLIQIGWDAAGGTTFAEWCTLGVGPATPIGNLRFALYSVLCDFPSGSTIGVRAAVNTATLTAGRVIVDAYGRPSPSHAWANAARATDIGIDTATSAGVTVTPGTTAEGAWAEIGTLAADAFAFEFGIGVNDAAIAGSIVFVDFGIGTASGGGGTGSDCKVIVKDLAIMFDAAEAISRPSALTYASAASGQALWCRMQHGPSGGVPTSISASAVAFHH